jgi:hypothetical protein
MATEKQINPQNESGNYSKKTDKRKTAKPVGFRFTNTKADDLNKKRTTKPTTAEIKKYLGKGVYKEKRKDKSDVKPKDKLAKGGKTEQTYAQSP